MYDIPSPRLDSGARLATTVLVATGAIARPTPWAMRTGTIHHSLGRGIYKTVVPTNINIPKIITLLGPDFRIHLPAIGRKITPANPKVAMITPISQSFPPSLSINPGTTMKREKKPARSKWATKRFITKSLDHKGSEDSDGIIKVLQTLI
jgi:hypothetical protein